MGATSFACLAWDRFYRSLYTCNYSIFCPLTCLIIDKDYSFNSLPLNLPKTYSFLSHECAKKHSDFDFLLFSIKFLTICLLLSLSTSSSSLMLLLLLLFSNPSYCLSLLLDFQTSCHYLCKAKHSKTSSAWRTNLSCSETFLNVGLFYCAFVKQVQKLRSKKRPL